MQKEFSPRSAGGVGYDHANLAESNKHRNLIGIKPGAKAKSSHRVNVANRDHDSTPGSLHPADL